MLNHFDRYVGDLKGFLTCGGLDRQAHADCCNQCASVHCKLRRLFDRQNISVLVSSENGDDFVKHLCTIWCEFRLAFVVKCPRISSPDHFHNGCRRVSYLVARAVRFAYAFLVYMLPPLPRCSGWAWSSLISPNRVSLPRKGRRVGLHIVLFEMLWGGGEEIAYIVADVTDGGPQCKSRTT